MLCLFKTIYDHAGADRGSIVPGGPDTYRETCYTRVDKTKSFHLRETDSHFET